jgi:N-acetyl-1-D-myo-inositol-2-amino-2-deoxy-alpha-D-glucopyranoside deacetylase
MATLLVALPHPDDETFGVGGVMARAAEEGHRVVIVCATRGEVGEIADPTLATPETLGAVREGELRTAAAALGVQDVRFMGYRDSGMAGTPENQDPRAFVNADATSVVGHLVALIRDVRPDVVVTFDPGGVYGHPDHVAMCDRVTSAVDAAAQPGGAGAPHQVARLYYIAVPKSVMRLFREVAEAAGAQWGAGVDLDAAPEDSEVTARIDVTPWLERKKAAVRAHATQQGTLSGMSEEFRERMYATEWFMIARGRSGAEILAGL